MSAWRLRVWLICVLFGVNHADIVQLRANDTPQYFQSPGFPAMYPSDTPHLWNITGDFDKHVLIETVEFQLYDDANGNCSQANDTLTLFSGYNYKDVATLCGDHGGFFEINGSSVLLVFASDSIYESRGFNISYYQVRAGAPCNHHVKLPDGVPWLYLTSPGFPRGYFSNLECNYTITASVSREVRIAFIDDSQLEDSSRCQNDSLVISNKDHTLGTLCGRIPDRQTFQSTGGQLQLRFTTDDKKNNKGFHIRMLSVDKTDCDASLYASRLPSYLLSPGYPSGYYSNLACHWEIEGQANTTIALTTLQSDIAGAGANCTGDKVKVVEAMDGTILKTFCGNATHNFTNLPSAMVTLDTDAATEAMGFMMKYQLEEEAIVVPTCGDPVTLADQSLAFTSPLYPHSPLIEHSCVWTFTAPSNDIIRISLIDLDIEMSDGCIYDSLTLYDDSKVTQGKELTKLCGPRSGQVLYSSGNILTVRYAVDNSDNGRGMNFTVSTIKGSRPLVETVNIDVKSSVSYLSSPWFNYKFIRNTTINYVFTAPPGNKILLEVTSSNLPFSNHISHKCDDAKGTVFDGVTTSGPVIFPVNVHETVWCGRHKPMWVSNGNTLLLEYYTGSTATKQSGFQLKYSFGSFPELSAHTCGGIHHATSDTKTFTSPFYPSNYANNMACTWTIQASTGGAMVHITIMDLELQNDIRTGCTQGDTLTLYDGTVSNGTVLTTLCDALQAISTQSSGNSVIAVFETDSARTGKGFSLQYFETTEPYQCGRSTLTVTHLSHMTYTSSYFTGMLNPNDECTWVFTKEQDKDSWNIQLTVKTSSAGNIGSNETCSENSISILDGDSVDGPQIGKFCGGASKSYLGSGNDMVAKMVIGNNPVVAGYAIAFELVTDEVCGRTMLTAESYYTYIESPYFGHHYPNNLDCAYDINVDGIDHHVVLEIVSSDLQESTNCIKDYIEVFDGYDGNTILGRSCGSQTPHYEGSINGLGLYVKFHTDASISKSGFKLRFKTKNAPFVSSVGLIVGLSIGGTAFFFLIVIVVAVICIKKNAAKQNLTGGPSYMYNNKTNQQNMPVHSNNTYANVNNAY